MLFISITYTKENHVAFITLNRPDAQNVINQQMAQEIIEVCHQINQEDDIYVVVITGAGDKVFCSGGEPLKLACNVSEAVYGIDRPVIAAINGDALREGLELALSCDIRIASAQAQFDLPQVSQGLIPMNGGTQRLPRIAGRGKALELILTAETISAEQALEIGIVNGVFAADRLMVEVKALAKNMAAKAPIALRYIKESINKGLDLTLEQGLGLEADLYFLLHTTADRVEGIRSFLEKRQPKFEGK